MPARLPAYIFQGGFERCLGDSFSTSQAHDDWVVWDSSELSVLQKEGASPTIAEGRGGSLILKKEGAVRYAVKRRSVPRPPGGKSSPLFSSRKDQSSYVAEGRAIAKIGTKISNTFCMYGKSGSLHKPYTRTFPPNGNGIHSKGRKSDSESAR